MIEDIGVEAYTALPGHGRRFRIDADFLELAHVAPQLEGADLEQVAEEHPALEPVLEAQPQLVVLFRPAFGDPVHLVPLLCDGRSSLIPSSARRRSDTRSPGSRRSCALSSGRSSRSSTGTGWRPPGRARPSRSAGSGGWRWR